MNLQALRQDLVAKAREVIKPNDPSHDILHSLRVLGNVEYLASREGGDLEILIPAALFHDGVNYPKNTPEAKLATEHSAELATRLLEETPEYPAEKIPVVAQAIRDCSFSKGIVPDTLEGKILQDADMLETVGAIAIMRMFTTSGQIGRAFYHEDDPFHETSRDLEGWKYCLDGIESRVLAVEHRLHTPAARELAKPGFAFVRQFLDQLKRELAHQS
jgi:uncharacterized protein